MTVRRMLAAPLLAIIALAPVGVQAQQSCVTEAEVSAMAIYSVPTLMQAVGTRCAAQLAPTGFLARRAILHCQKTFD